MTATHWIRIATLASALGLAGTAIAQGTDRAPRGNDRSAVESPSAGAIVTPEDKALGMGKSDRREDRNADVIGDRPAPNDEMTIDPGTSSDDMSVSPGPANDAMIVAPDGADANRSGGTVRPGEMGPANLRGQ
jgi:hypothetical protein